MTIQAFKHVTQWDKSVYPNAADETNYSISDDAREQSYCQTVTTPVEIEILNGYTARMMGSRVTFRDAAGQNINDTVSQMIWGKNARVIE